MTAVPDKVMPDFCNRRFPFHLMTAINTLVKLGLDTARIDMKAVGPFENYKGEVHRQEPEPGTPLDKKTRVTLEVGFSGAVDELPYQFFYGLAGTRVSTGAWEDDSRNLMAPFDAAVIRHLATAEYQDLKSNFGLVEFEHLNNVLSLFGFDLSREGISFREAMVWSSLFPTFHHWAGNAEIVCKALECLFGYDFRIIENVPVEHEIPANCRYRLGSRHDRLGRGSIVGRRYSDNDTGYEVIVENIRPEEARDLLPGGSVRKRIERALKVFMPGYLEGRIRVRSTKEAVGIGGEKRKSYLGYTWHIRT